MTDMIAGIASPSGVVVAKVPRPDPGRGELLVKVIAAGLNRADLGAARNAFSARPGPIGMEWSGEVVALGEGATGFALGDLVACSGAGGYAEYAVADAGRALPVGAIDPFASAGLPLALMTAHNALVTEGRFAAGQSVLVHGATSGVGIALIKIAKLLGARTVIGTSTSAEKRGLLAGFGVDYAIDPGEDGWVQHVLDATDGKGADVVIDMVTGAGINETMRATALHGQIVNVGRLAGKRADFDLDLHALRRIRFSGVTFRSRTPDEIRAIVAHVRRELWPAVEQGRLAIPIDRSFALSDVSAAHARMAANRHLGKILLRP
jgi:NADPH2:quinone reductase